MRKGGRGGRVGKRDRDTVRQPKSNNYSSCELGKSKLLSLRYFRKQNVLEAGFISSLLNNLDYLC